MKIQEEQKQVIVTIAKGIATDMADRLVDMGFSVDEVRMPTKSKAHIIIDKPDNATDFVGVVEAAAHTILDKMSTSFNED